MTLSDIFKYISKFRHAGHQVGRKVGDMLEVLTYAALYRDTALRQRLQIEPKIFGFCDAGHKVEFGILIEPKKGAATANNEAIEDPSVLLGFVECKKVGVEQTVGQSFKKAYAAKHYQFDSGSVLEFSMGRNSAHPAAIRVTLQAASNDTMTVTVDVNGENTLSEAAKTGHRLIFSRTAEGGFVVIGNKESLRDIPHPLEACRILEIKSVANRVATLLLNDCLAGPQTPEKAKQASFVALDVRKKRFGQFDKRQNETEMLSVLVLTEYSHWEAKSQSIVKACLDRVLIVPDELIIEAFVQFENEFGATFYDNISKEQYATNVRVARIADRIVADHRGEIFVDAVSGRDCSFRYHQGRFEVA